MFARFQNRDIRVLSASVNWQLNAAIDFGLEVPLQELPDITSARMRDIEIYRRGELFVEGFITDSPSVELNPDGVLVSKLNGFGGLGRLTMYRAKTNSHYQDMALLDILEDLLLATAGTWSLGDTSTMVDPEIETTIDLRSKEELFAQLVAAAKAVPDVYLRYGGKSNGVHLIDVGNFNQRTQRFIEGYNLVDLKRKRVSAPLYKVVEAYGDWAGTEERLSLQYALSDPRTQSHPDYARFPISFDPVTETWIVEDTEAEVGNHVTQFFNLSKTKNDEPPTAEQISEAGYALWLKTVRFLKSHVEHDEYSGEVLLPEVPPIGDHAFIRSKIYEPVFDRVTKRVQYEPIFSVDDSYRITDVSYKFEDGVLLDRSGLGVTDETVDVFDIEVSSNDEAEKLDPDLELYEKLEPADTFDNTAQSMGFLIPEPITVTHTTSDAADCIYSGGSNNGKTFTLQVPDIPKWVKNVSVTYSIDPAGTTFNLVQLPKNPNQSLILCVGPWPFAGDVSVTAQFVLTK